MNKTKKEKRSCAKRFTFQFSFRDTEAMEWFEAQPHKGAYLKSLILADKAQRGQSGGELSVVTRRDRLDADWEERFALVQAFADEYGRLPTRDESYRGVKLGRWLDIQKRKFQNSETDERSARLKRMGAMENRWEQTYRLTVAFREEYGRLPKPTEQYRGISIGKWLETQCKRTTDSDRSEHAEKLRALGALVSKWDRQFEILCAFYNKYGEMPKYHDHFQNTAIGRWLDYQTKTVDPHTHPERYEKLEQLGALKKGTPHDENKDT